MNLDCDGFEQGEVGGEKELEREKKGGKRKTKTLEAWVAEKGEGVFLRSCSKGSFLLEKGNKHLFLLERDKRSTTIHEKLQLHLIDPDDSRNRFFFLLSKPWGADFGLSKLKKEKQKINFMGAFFSSLFLLPVHGLIEKTRNRTSEGEEEILAKGRVEKKRQGEIKKRKTIARIVPG